MMIKS
jgi:hypothetical protein